MQTSSTLIDRVSGMATILSGPLWALGGIAALNYENIPGISMEDAHLLLTLAGLCSLIGLSRLASHHARQYGRAGMAGAILASAGVVLVIVSKNLPSSTSAETGWDLLPEVGLVRLVVLPALLDGAPRGRAAARQRSSPSGRVHHTLACGPAPARARVLRAKGST
jgi:hypothetical protein